jgi:hypothetical protein
MTNSILLTLIFGFSIYFLAGFYFISNQKQNRQIRVSIFNPYDKFNYQATIHEKVKKQVISRDEYEWLNAEKFGSPLK